ncbi:MAG: hypothetical protein AAF530_23740 [Pseudomonadota bacterium]
MRNELKRKTFTRMQQSPSGELEVDPSGPIFSSPIGDFDLSGVHILHSGFDTVRSLYRGKLNQDLFQTIEDTGFDKVMRLGGPEWIIGAGGKSGYRYRLQNNEIGLILFLGARHSKTTSPGAHLKIEAGPSFLLPRAVDEAQHYWDSLASTVLLENWDYSGCAIHLCADIQGWDFPEDFVERLVTRSRQIIQHNGIAKIELYGDVTCQLYGYNETATFGFPNGFQFTCYAKDVANRRQDKIDFWEKIWNQTHDEDGVVLYDPAKPVRRIEYRLHQSIVREIASECGEKLLNYEALAERATDIWCYGLSTFRLDLSRTYVDPFWQLLYEDIQMGCQPRREMIKRVYKGPGSSEQRNVGLAIGNLLSVFAREKRSPRDAIQALKKAGVWKKFVMYQRLQGRDPQAEIVQGLSRRRLGGSAS